MKYLYESKRVHIILSNLYLYSNIILTIYNLEIYLWVLIILIYPFISIINQIFLYNEIQILNHFNNLKLNIIYFWIINGWIVYWDQEQHNILLQKYWLGFKLNLNYFVNPIQTIYYKILGNGTQKKFGGLCQKNF